MGGGGGSAYLKVGDMFQLDSATFILLAHTHDSRLEEFTGLQNENLESSNSKFKFPERISSRTATVITNCHRGAEEPENVHI